MLKNGSNRLWIANVSAFHRRSTCRPSGRCCHRRSVHRGRSPVVGVGGGHRAMARKRRWDIYGDEGHQTALALNGENDTKLWLEMGKLIRMGWFRFLSIFSHWWHINRQETCNGLVFWCVWKRGEPQIANFEITLFWDLLKSSQIGVRNQAMDTAGKNGEPGPQEFINSFADVHPNSFGGSKLVHNTSLRQQRQKTWLGDWGEHYSDDFGLRPYLGLLLVLDRKAGMENSRHMATTLALAFCEQWGYEDGVPQKSHIIII